MDDASRSRDRLARYKMNVIKACLTFLVLFFYFMMSFIYRVFGRVVAVLCFLSPFVVFAALSSLHRRRNEEDLRRAEILRESVRESGRTAERERARRRMRPDPEEVRKEIERGLVTRTVGKVEGERLTFEEETGTGTQAEKNADEETRARAEKTDDDGLPDEEAPDEEAPKTEDPTEPDPQSCDICLTPYEPGDELCFSRNRECPHVFHKECLLEWLVKNPHCPVCRRDYLLTDEELAAGARPPERPAEAEAEAEERPAEDPPA